MNLAHAGSGPVNSRPAACRTAAGSSPSEPVASIPTDHQRSPLTWMQVSSAMQPVPGGGLTGAGLSLAGSGNQAL